MPAFVDFTETAILTGFRSMLLQMLPVGIEVIRAQVNKVPEPVGPDFVMMTPLRRERLSTNVDADTDIILTGDISGTILTVDAINQGALVPGMMIAVPPGGPAAAIVGLLGGSGGVGTYSVTPSQTVPSGTLYAGLHAMLVPTEYCLQVDFHGPNSADMAQAVMTMARDEVTVQMAERSGLNLATLYASDPRQLAFLDAEAQYEDRWMIEWHAQANVTTSVFQDFADQLAAQLMAVEAGVSVSVTAP